MSRSAFLLYILILCWLVIPSLSIAQCPGEARVCAPTVPHLLNFNGVLRDPSGNPRTGTVGITFSIYGDPSSSTTLWQETQNVQLNAAGRYNVFLGSATTDGVPLDLFRSGEPRWLGAQVLLPGEREQPRVLLVSVPYALRAADAETLGGLPASAFVKLPPTSTERDASARDAISGRSTAQAVAEIPGAPAASAEVPVTTPGGSPNAIAKFSVSPSIGNSQIADTNGIVTLQNLANIFFADQFPDGVPGALAACPAEGCTIYAGSESVNRNLGSIDPGTKIVTIYLGPFTYNVKHITLQKGLRIIGMGASIPGTILQSVNGNDPVFVLPQGNNLPVTSVLLSGLRIIGSLGNSSEDAFFLDSSSLVNSGLWYSEINDLTIYNFAGNGIHLRGPGTNFGAMTQWTQFNNVFVTRTPGGGNALRMEGANFQLHFTNCEFDGPGIGDGTNIYIGGLPGGGNFSFPFDITFRGLVTQAAAVAVQMDGAETVTFQTSHHELVWGVYLITGSSNIWNRGISIQDSVFNSNVGVNNGTGYLLNVATTLAQGIYFGHNRLSSPDSVVVATNSAQVVYQDNEYLGTLNVPPTAGITTQITSADSINIGGAHSIAISPNPSNIPVTTIQSSLGPGEMVTFAATGGAVTFATGGNIGLPGATLITVNGTITFIRNDLSGNQSQWWPVSQWSASNTGGGDFSLSPVGPSSATVSAGQTAVYTLLVAPLGQFAGSVGFMCAGIPKLLSCTVSPDPASVRPGSLQQVSVTVQPAPVLPTPGFSAATPPFRFRLSQYAGLAFGLLLPIRAPRRRRHGKPARLRLVALLLGLLPLAGCGALAGNAGDPSSPGGGTTKTYTLAVTGISGNIRHSVTLTLNVI